MGEACARLLVARGARVAVCDVNAEGASNVARNLGAAARFYAFDVRDEAGLEAGIADVETSLGPIDHLVVASGMFRASPALDTPLATWSELFAINVLGSVSCLRVVGARMRERHFGSIVVIASQSAKVVRHRQVAYGSSKAALTYAAKVFGLELAAFNVRVNLVHPGVTDTPLSRELWNAGRGSPERHVRGAPESYRVPIPLGKIALADDVAAAALFLLSDAAGHTTMAEVLVDGGSTLMP